MSSSSSLGLTFKVSPEIAASLRQGNEPSMNQARSLAHEQDEQDLPFTPSASEAEYQQQQLQEEEEDDWDELLPLPKPLNVNGDESNSVQSNEVLENDSDRPSDDDDDDDVSTTPPPSLPCVVVNLKKLCGYEPSTKEQAEELRNQVHTALILDEDDDGLDKDTATKEDDLAGNGNKEQLSRHFEARVGELFENGVANHGDTEMLEDSDTNNSNNSTAILQYPEFYCRKDGRVVVTAREWKKLLQSHQVPVVNRLLLHLRNCNRIFSWKCDMGEQIRNLAISQEEQAKQDELLQWKTERRGTQLDKLYQVRETFEDKLKMAQDRLEQLENERSIWVRQELRNQGLGGVDGLDFDSSTIYAFDGLATTAQSILSNQREAGSEEEDDEGYMQSQDEESSFEDDSSFGDHGENDITSDLPSRTATTPARTSSRKKRTKKYTKRRQQAMENQAEEARRMARLEQACAEEERVLQTCPLNSKVEMAQAVVTSLEQRMTQVDDLLESLQEEEWADEEECCSKERAPVQQQQLGDESNAEEEMTLLDQVLAMILGALPLGERSPEDHYKFVRDEHQAIKREWKEHFGKLPESIRRAPSNPSPRDSGSKHEDLLQQQMQDMGIAPPKIPSQKEPVSADAMRSALGIADVDGDWEDDNDWDDVLPGIDSRMPDHNSASKTKSTKVGLRPGGKAPR